jgi:arylsulfatase A-like enzyme
MKRRTLWNRWTRHLPVIALLSLGCVVPDGPASTASGPTATNRFNVLFLAVDDLRPELGCYGVDYVRTPHIDALADEGVTFLSHFASVPTCGASRYALLTGRSPGASGVRSGNQGLYQGAAALSPELLPGAQSLPELFRRSGYQTTLIGKLSHTADGKVFAYNGEGDGRPELPHAWDELATPYGSWQRGWGTFFAYADGAHREDGTGRRELMEFVAEADDELPDGMMASAAIDKLADLADSDEPFFLGLGFFKPHLPFVATRSDWEAVQEWELPDLKRTERLPSAYAPGSGEFFGYDTPWIKSRPLPADAADQARRAYLACLRYTDRQVGRVLDALDDLGLAESTVVVLWSDHGWFLGEGDIWGKHTPLERAMASPLIIRTPGAALAGQRTDALASTLDIYPTLIDLCRPTFTATHFPLDGESLVPILSGQVDSVSEVVRGYWNNASTVRSQGHRLILRKGERGWRDVELYDAAGEWAVDISDERPEVVLRLSAFVD